MKNPAKQWAEREGAKMRTTQTRPIQLNRVAKDFSEEIELEFFEIIKRKIKSKSTKIKYI